MSCSIPASLLKSILPLLLLLTCTLASLATDGAEPKELMELSLEELMRVDITSVGKKSQHLSESAAAAFVISQDDIQRSGATNIPDALRMVPGVQVARIDSNKWAVSARGFNGRFAKDLLVLIDGRSVYSPTFSGVYWDMQDVMLEDVERIEVIRGPGATLWGSNAVNGVINIITKSAADTQGGRLSAGTGTVEKAFGAFRYGARLGENTHARIYGKGFERGSFNSDDGRNSGDDWDRGQGGFRLDHEGRDGNSATLQGNAYAGNIGQRLSLPNLVPPSTIYVQDTARISGFNLLGKWRKSLSLDSELSIQAYYDHTYRKEYYATQEIDTYDLEFQHRFSVEGWHDIVWGLGYRLNQDRISSTDIATFGSPQQDRQLFSAFIQDEMTLIEDKLKLTLGSKVEHNDFTGFEGQPNIRLSWTPSSRHSLWGAVSRAVRIPSRIENDARALFFILPPAPQTFNSPVALYAVGNSKFHAEELLAYEAGYRFIPNSRFSADLALFYNVYEGIRDIAQGPYLIDPVSGLVTVNSPFVNNIKGASYGAELAADWKVADFWTLQAAYSYLKMDLRGSDFTAPGTALSSPQNQLSVRSSLALPRQVSLDLWLRYVDRILSGFPDTRLGQPVEDYVTLDARIAWQAMPNLELSLVGQNLIDNRHKEFAQEIFAPKPTQVPRSVYFKVDWRF